jgi:hypothetical protein
MKSDLRISIKDYRREKNLRAADGGPWLRVIAFGRPRR